MTDHIFKTKHGTEIYVLGPHYVKYNGSIQVSPISFRGIIDRIGYEMPYRFDAMKEEATVRKVVAGMVQKERSMNE